jgi:hypothetical protein
MKVTLHSAIRQPQRLNPAVLITGDGRSLIRDMDRFHGWRLAVDTCCIGRSINIQPGRVLHWCNVDGPTSEWWAEHLPLKNNGDFPYRHTLGEVRGYDCDWDVEDEPLLRNDEVIWNGSTALFAVLCCVAMDYEKIIMAGCPMDSAGHWHQDAQYHGPRWRGEDYQAWLEFAKQPEAARVRSLSGYTAQIVGKATMEFLTGK